MYNHAPKNYNCSLCGIVSVSNNQLTKQSDVFYRDKFLTAYISPNWWPNNPGHVIIITNEHIENIYDISEELLSKVNIMAKKIAIALKEIYKCDGTSIRQHNEPAGSQTAWHFHIHVFPRYINDDLYELNQSDRLTEPNERKPYADKLRKYFSEKSI